MVAAGATRVKAPLFEHRPDVGAWVGELLVAPALEGRCPGVRPHEAQEYAERRALARPVRAQEPGHPTGLDGERQAGHRLYGPEALAHLVNLDRGHATRIGSTTGCGRIGR